MQLHRHHYNFIKNADVQNIRDNTSTNSLNLMTSFIIQYKSSGIHTKSTHIQNYGSVFKLYTRVPSIQNSTFTRLNTVYLNSDYAKQ
ncbi:hypothetical protein Hanom_Chr09g00843871 [Helianthus anomalus]